MNLQHGFNFIHQKQRSILHNVWGPVKVREISNSGPICKESHGKSFKGFPWQDTYGLFRTRGRTITGEYDASLLDGLQHAIKTKRLHLAKEKVTFHQDKEP